MYSLDINHKIKVELIPKTEKGKAYHQVALRGAVQKKKTGEVLSEGEFRVVSLSAFLADLSSWDKVLPFIFDDPITSLDQKYEEMVAKRLVKLSHERQVIVFPHIYPYRNGAGEIDFYRLKLTVNRVGKAFLEINDFLENNKFYIIDKIF